MNGARFFPSGRRFGPYFSRRLDASAAPRPFSVVVATFFTTSSTGIAYQATTLLAVSACVGAVMLAPRKPPLGPLPRQRARIYAVVPKSGQNHVRLTGLNLMGVLDRSPTSLKKCTADMMGYSNGPAFRKISIAKAPMNKAITSIGGIKLLLRENRHQSPHAAIMRVTVPAYRETVSMPLAPSGQDTCSPTIAQCEWHRSQATSINRLVKPLVIQTA